MDLWKPALLATGRQKRETFSPPRQSVPSHSKANRGEGGGGRQSEGEEESKRLLQLSGGMPVTRRRAAVAAVAQEEGRDAAIYISSDSDAGSDPEDTESEEEEDTSDEDFIDVSDSEADDGESSDEEGEEDSESEAEAEAEQLGADRSEVACNKIAGLLSSNILEPLYLSPCNFRTDPQSFKHSQNKVLTFTALQMAYHLKPFSVHSQQS